MKRPATKKRVVTARPGPARVSIYGVIDPARPNQVRYVGKTVNLPQRLRQHVALARRKNGPQTPFYRWLRPLVQKGKAPVLVLLGYCRAADWEAEETAYIRRYRALGHPLLNLAPGGGYRYQRQQLKLRAAKGRKYGQARLCKQSASRVKPA